MRLDWHNDPACERFLFHAGKLAKIASNLNIAHTKPVDSVPIESFGTIERNWNSLGRISEALVAPHGGKLCRDLIGKKRLAVECGGPNVRKIYFDRGGDTP